MTLHFPFLSLRQGVYTAFLNRGSAERLNRVSEKRSVTEWGEGVAVLPAWGRKIVTPRDPTPRTSMCPSRPMSSGTKEGTRAGSYVTIITEAALTVHLEGNQ